MNVILIIGYMNRNFMYMKLLIFSLVHVYYFYLILLFVYVFNGLMSLILLNIFDIIQYLSNVMLHNMKNHMIFLLLIYCKYRVVFIFKRMNFMLDCFYFIIFINQLLIYKVIEIIYVIIDFFRSFFSLILLFFMKLLVFMGILMVGLIFFRVRNLYFKQDMVKYHITFYTV
jgi:hypothetical protein